ncbi:homocysteine S-methyltransferase family protein [Candidatus Woesearchaeota archaeon]|nr:homocysteine S-methyltransferase family protein [Candidatus Woesearchaeota archaeon]
MGRLEEFLKTRKRIILSGPYGTRVAERVARDKVKRPQKATNVSENKFIGAACSALLTEEGQEYLREIASDYLNSVPKEHPLILVTPSFRLAKQTLESAASVSGADPNLPRRGLELCIDSLRICQEAINSSGRSRENTLLAMSIGPPFDCYRGKDTFPDIDNKYLPQTFAAIRFGRGLDYLMFETVPSLLAAHGVAIAFNKAHQELNIPERLGSFQRMGTIHYLGNVLPIIGKFLGEDALTKLCPSYNPKTDTFAAVEPEKDYVISLCLDKNGCIYPNMSLDLAIRDIYAKSRGNKQPVGIGINCNSLEVTEAALSRLSAKSLGKVIGIHPNASSENDPENYERMTKQQAIPTDEFVEAVTRLADRYGLHIIGGCCGTNEITMRGLAQAR